MRLRIHSHIAFHLFLFLFSTVARCQSTLDNSSVDEYKSSVSARLNNHAVGVGPAASRAVSVPTTMTGQLA